MLHYSNADSDISRALAYARRGSSDPGTDSASSGTLVDRQPPAATDRQPPASSSPAAKPIGPQPAAPPGDGTIRLAGGAAQPPVSSALPYPIVALGMLAGVLLVGAAIGWLARRRT